LHEAGQLHCATELTQAKLSLLKILNDLSFVPERLKSFYQLPIKGARFSESLIRAQQTEFCWA
jgi:hypothetical protein